MNQILVTEKLYITPELKRKRKIYKFEFFVSLFAIFILTSLYVYAEFERGKSEEVSQQILASMEDTTIATNNLLVVILDEEEDSEDFIESNVENVGSGGNITSTNAVGSNTSSTRVTQTTQTGYNYVTVATINIPKINVNYPILDGVTDTPEETEALLKISPTKFWGPEPNKKGNFCVVGHNYRNTKFFSKVLNLVNDDIIEITDTAKNATVQYKVYNKYEVDPSDLSCTSQLTDGRREITLITCTNDSKARVIVKAREV